MRNCTLRKRVVIGTTLSFLFALLFLSGCGSNYIGYGVVYWSPDERLVPNGSMLPILRQSSIEKSYTLEIDGHKEGWSTDEWRIGFFEKKDEALAEEGRYEPFIHLFAVSQRDRLAIRQEPDIDSERAYVLRLGQEMKIIDQENQQDSVGQYEGHWYKVLTDDGTMGYCFDHYLEAYDGRTGPSQKVSPELAFVKEALSRVYRPEYFREMRRSNKIVLERFSPRFGFFPDLAQQSIEMRLPSGNRTFSYESIEYTEGGSYVFTGSGLSVNFFGENAFAATFPVDGNNSSERFVFIPEDDITMAIENERQRRADEVLRFAEAEYPIQYRSSAYGTLKFHEDATFEWTGKQRLSPEVIPADSGDKGTFSFDYFLGSQVASKYDGVINLTFDQGQNLLFFYTLNESGLRLTTIDQRSVEKNIVQKVSFSPLVMAFFKEQE
jgi:hypothetical protein